MENKKGFKKLIIAAVALVAIAAIFAIVYFNFIPKGNNFDKTITVEVVYGDASSEEFIIETNEEFLRNALEQEDLVKGDESEYGLYIKEVNGVSADYNTDGAYWGLSKDGEYLMTGIDTTAIADGEHYEITYTVGN